MKTLKEQILKKIVKKAFNSGLNAEADESFPFSANADKYWNKHKFEIESLIKENYIEKEFMEWLIYNHGLFDGEGNAPDLKYLHNYWLNNIKDKGFDER